jgi:hypothetical protein
MQGRCERQDRFGSAVFGHDDVVRERVQWRYIVDFDFDTGDEASSGLAVLP